MLSETGWHQEQELIHFDRQSVGIDCTILILSPDQCSPKPNVDSFGSNDKLRQNVSKTPEMVNLEILHPAVDRWDPKSDYLVQQHSAPFGSVFPLFRFHPSFQRCPLQRWACLSPVILISAVEPLMMVSHLASDPSLETFHLWYSFWSRTTFRWNLWWRRRGRRS